LTTKLFARLPLRQPAAKKFCPREHPHPVTVYFHTATSQRLPINVTRYTHTRAIAGWLRRKQQGAGSVLQSILKKSGLKQHDTTPSFCVLSGRVLFGFKDEADASPQVCRFYSSVLLRSTFALPFGFWLCVCLLLSMLRFLAMQHLSNLTRFLAS